jgi:peptide/nickel transport system substrate-binding protein
MALLATGAIALPACVRLQPHLTGVTRARHPWTVPNVLRIAIQGSPDTLQPLLTSDTTDKMIGRLLFDPLVSVDAGGTHAVPILAARVPTLANGDIARDGMSITYHLRRGVRWHDGAALTSKDVAFSVRAILSPANDVSSRAGYDLVKTVDTPDRYTAVFHLKKRYSPAVNTLFAESDTPMFVVPEHLLGRLPNVNSAAFNVAPIGTGPFVFSKWLRGDRLELVANQRYFLGKPKLKAIVIRMIPNEDTELDALRTHAIDWIFEPSPRLYGELRTLPDIKTPLGKRNEVEELLINQQREALADVRVRRAIAHALDRAVLLRNLTFGSAREADDEHPPFMWAHLGGMEYAYDPARARELLASAGWLPGSDGLVEKRGRRLALTLAYNGSNATRRSAVVLVQSYLRAIGIETTLKSYPLTLFAAPLGSGGILAGGAFDLSLTGFVAGIDPDDSVRFRCRAFPPGGDNYVRYCRTAMDAAQSEALGSYAVAIRKRAYARIQKLIHRDVPQVFLWWPRQVQAISDDFSGFAPNPVNEAWNAYEWSI